MDEKSSREVTRLLQAWRSGDRDAFDALIAAVYPELRRIARRHMRQERPGHTLQASALLNEAYMRLMDYRNMQWQDRAHFFAVAAQAMRRILVDHARNRQSAKRGGGAIKVELNESALATADRDIEIIELDRALESLAAKAPRKAKVVELRYFGGLTAEETAEALGVSPVTVAREWESAKAWLLRAIAEGNRGDP